ncbi:MAG: transglycosylase SLT domain-containing protein [Candidatus Sericytochromatia bacterium]
MHSAWTPSPTAIHLQLVSQLVQQQGKTAMGQARPVHPGGWPSRDQLRLAPPQQIFQARLPALQFGLSSRPADQLASLGRKYGVPPHSDPARYQSEVIKAVIRVKAQQYGIPEHIALGISGNESGWKMWRDLNTGKPVEGQNKRDGQLLSTDWGAMQINDKAHPRAFPRAKQDLEYNVDYALSYLARQRERIQGSLNLGLGDWDRTVASYNLGHNPSTERALATAERYVSRVKERSQQA